MTPAIVSRFRFKVNPLRGAILPYVPIGHSIAISVGTSTNLCGGIVLLAELNKSTPTDPRVDKIDCLAFLKVFEN